MVWKETRTRGRRGGTRDSRAAHLACASTMAADVTDAARLWAEIDSGLLTDILTCGCINTASDTLAQLTERADAPTGAFDAGRTRRLALFGLADGAVSHAWFLALDGMVGEGQGAVETLSKTAADAFLYTPLWCLWFLLAMAVLESSDWRAVPHSLRRVPSIWRSDWLDLLRGNLGFFLPFTGLIYALVPRERRVFAFGMASLIYTTFLSLWNSKRARAEDEDLPPDPRIPLPRPPRAAIRLRRVIRATQRATRTLVRTARERL